MEKSRLASPPSLNLLVALLVVLGLLAGAYYSLRYSGLAMEVDASRQAISAQGIVASGRLVYSQSYNNGFAYGAQLALASMISGIDINSIQLGSGAWVFVLALVGFIAYRELIGSSLGGALAAFLLLIQPDFLFYVVRGSHERSTWTCALLMLFFLVRSYRYAESPYRLLATVLLFYLSFWGMTSGNVYFASTFMMAIALSLAIGWVLDRVFLRRQPAAQLLAQWWRRLLLVSFICIIIVYIFINDLYAPALQTYRLFKNLIDQLAMLILGLQPIEPTETYAAFGAAWRDSASYLLVTGVQWAVAIAGFVTWIVMLFRLPRLSPGRRLLWQLYTSFGILLLLGVVADFAKFLNTNLQLRMFTPFTLFSSGLVALGLQSVWGWLRPAARRLLAPAVGLLAVFAFVVTQVKITNDPLVGNQWSFYSPAEVRAVEWANARVQGQRIWVDLGSRLPHTFYFLEGYAYQRPNAYAFGIEPVEYPYILVTQLVQMRASRIEAALPATNSHLKIYDNGTAELYHRRPLTPYQR